MANRLHGFQHNRMRKMNPSALGFPLLLLLLLLHAFIRDSYSEACDMDSLSLCLSRVEGISSSRNCSHMWMKLWSESCDPCSGCIGNVSSDLVECAYGFPYWDDFLCPMRYNASVCPCVEGKAVSSHDPDPDPSIAPPLGSCIDSVMNLMRRCAEEVCIKDRVTELIACVANRSGNKEARGLDTKGSDPRQSKEEEEDGDTRKYGYAMRDLMGGVLRSSFKTNEGIIIGSKRSRKGEDGSKLSYALRKSWGQEKRKRARNRSID